MICKQLIAFCCIAKVCPRAKRASSRFARPAVTRVKPIICRAYLVRLFLSASFADATGSRTFADSTLRPIPYRAISRITIMPGALTGKASSSSVAILALLHHAPFVSTLLAEQTHQAAGPQSSPVASHLQTRLRGAGGRPVEPVSRAQCGICRAIPILEQHRTGNCQPGIRELDFPDTGLPDHLLRFARPSGSVCITFVGTRFSRPSNLMGPESFETQ
jgi:hypothetical protein